MLKCFNDIFPRYFNDNSLEDFLSLLYIVIANDEIQNSFQTFEYKNLNCKNKLYRAIESYNENKTNFYSKFLALHPEINIKCIKEIIIGEHQKGILKHKYENLKCSRYEYVGTGKYYVSFTIYYEKK